MAKIGKLEVSDGSIYRYVFLCPGCGVKHFVGVKGQHEGAHDFNGDFDRPTFSPSILTRDGEVQKRCHSFIRDGQIEFCADSGHALAGKTVPLPECPA